VFIYISIKKKINFPARLSLCTLSEINEEERESEGYNWLNDFGYRRHEFCIENMSNYKYLGMVCVQTEVFFLLLVSCNKYPIAARRYLQI
jgi:hypothetical protein